MHLAATVVTSLTVILRCTSVVSGSDGDAGGTGSRDAPPLDRADAAAPQDASPPDGAVKRCRWHARPPVEVTRRYGFSTHLVDAAATGDGAWVTYVALVSGPTLGYRVRSAFLGMEGLGLGDPLEHALSHDDIAHMETAWSPSDQTLALLSQGSVRCTWSTVGLTSRPETHRIDLGAIDGDVSRVGCRALLRTTNGHGFVSMRFGASPATDLITLDPAGRVTGARALSTPAAPALRFARIALADGDFALIWIDEERALPFHEHLRVQRVSPQGTPRGPVHTVAPDRRRLVQFALVETGEGMLAIWEEFSGHGIPEPYRLVTRALDPTGAPSASAVTQPSRDYHISGGLSATSRGADVLVTTLRSTDEYRADVLVLDARGAIRDRIDTGVVDFHGAYLATRTVATRDGALVLVTLESYRRFGSPTFVAAVPLRCE